MTPSMSRDGVEALRRQLGAQSPRLGGEHVAARVR